MDSDFPPLYKDQRIEDRKHLKLLSWAHYGFAGMLALGLVVLFLHYWILSHFLSSPWLVPNGCAKSPPLDIFHLLRWVYLVLGILIALGAVANALSGWFIAKRKYRTFTLVVNILNFPQMPFGMGLAIFTYIVLVRDSVVELYHPGLGGASST